MSSVFLQLRILDPSSVQKHLTQQKWKRKRICWRKTKEAAVQVAQETQDLHQVLLELGKQALITFLYLNRNGYWEDLKISHVMKDYILYSRLSLCPFCMLHFRASKLVEGRKIWYLLSDSFRTNPNKPESEKNCFAWCRINKWENVPRYLQPLWTGRMLFDCMLTFQKREQRLSPVDFFR